MSESFLNDRIELHSGDCLEILAGLDTNSIDSCVTDPPYHLTSIVKRFGADNAAPAKAGKTGAYTRASAGFMGKQWDGGDIAFRPELWAEVYRVLKPGAHLVAFSGTRTYHRMVCAIEDAGFEVRDQIGWAFGSGFPKSHDVSKGIDKAAGAERKILSEQVNRSTFDPEQQGGGGFQRGTIVVSAPATDEAAEWQGWGTALKPAWEPIVLARKPLIGTVAANVLEHGTGALNIDGCRVGDRGETQITGAKQTSNTYGTIDVPGGKELPPGRWPANLLHDGSDEVVEAFPETKSGELLAHHKKSGNGLAGSSTFAIRDRTGEEAAVYGDAGSAARFFYTAKADANDRIGSKHPTVKPLDLMQWLVRLVTPKGGLVLDPFAGTGTTGEAAFREGMRAVLIEREAEYQADIRRRMKFALGGPEERRREILRCGGKVQPVETLPLFGSLAEAAE